MAVTVSTYKVLHKFNHLVYTVENGETKEMNLAKDEIYRAGANFVAGQYLPSNWIAQYIADGILEEVLV